MEVLLGICPKKMKTLSQKDICTPMFLAIKILTIAKVSSRVFTEHESYLKSQGGDVVPSWAERKIYFNIITGHIFKN